MPDPPWTPEFTREVTMRDGIYRLLSRERLLQIEPFLAQYRRIRAEDGYRQRSDRYYRALPSVDPQDPQAASWRIRQESVRHLERVLRRFHGRRLRILDLGAGNGWLSAQLAMRGHACVAVDWLDDDADGLGAFRHYPVRFTCVQADFDDLMMAPGQFDLVIFNASLHYASQPARTVAHALQTLVPGGVVVVMDSPLFAGDEGGRRMLDAQRIALASICGSVVECGVGYLTERGLRSIARDAGLKAAWIPSRGGPGWAVGRVVAGLKQRRTPARFGVWVGGSPSASS